MKIVKFQTSTKDQWGVLEGETIRSIEGDPFNGIAISDETHSLSAVSLLAPISPLNKVPAIAANYGARDDRDGPGIFMKQPGTYQRHEGNIVFPRSCKTVIHEAEVGIVISKVARHIDEENALDYVFGYTCVNDVSARETVDISSYPERPEIGAGITMRWKHYDTFCPIGPHIETEINDPDNLDIECLVNGKLSASGNTRDMLFNIPKLVSWVSEVMTLYPGDIIPSGCPETAEINIGDKVEVKVEQIGTLSNTVIEDY